MEQVEVSTAVETERTAEKKGPARTFDHRVLRLAVGLIAFSIPFIVCWLARPEKLASISASYHSAARDAFVGMLFVVAAFLVAYRGHSTKQSMLSRLGALSAVCVAVFPTKKTGVDTVSDATHYIHLGAAVALLVILTIFCDIFRKAANEKVNEDGCRFARRRSRIYLIARNVMAFSLVAMAVSIWRLEETRVEELRIIFYGECVALATFGVAWFVAGQMLG